MASSSHNGALVFGMVLGVAGGAAWAIWNSTESGEKLRAETRAMIEAAFGRTPNARTPSNIRIFESAPVLPAPAADGLAEPVETASLSH